jgi:hypothetical protein
MVPEEDFKPGSHFGIAVQPLPAVGSAASVECLEIGGDGLVIALVPFGR